MNIETVQNTVWAILPAKLEEINAVIVHYLDGGERLSYDVTEYSNPVGEKIDGMKYSYQMQGGVRMLDIFGSISQRANLMTEFSGGISVEILNKEFNQALNDPSVTAILLNVNSPGGTVHGMKTLSDLIFESRSKKKICAYSDGLMCSAAYFIGSSASTIISTETSQIGSIGVCLTHYDMSKRDEESGVKRTEIFAGKYKRMGTDARPLDEEGKAYLQEMVDQYYSVFVETVARNRGVSVDEALSMADGKVFIGSEALKAGLVDHIGNIDAALSTLNTWRFGTMNEIGTHTNTTGITADDVLQVNSDERLKVEELTRELRLERIKSRVKDLMAEGKVTPAMIEDGLIEEIASLSESSAEWMLNSFLPSMKQTVMREEFARDGVVVDPKDLEKELALKIARNINPEATL